MSAAVKAVVYFVAAVAVDIVAIVVPGAQALFYVGNVLQALSLGQLITALNGTPKRGGGPPAPWQFMANGSTYPRTIIYGETRVSGVAVYERLKH